MNNPNFDFRALWDNFAPKGLRYNVGRALASVLAKDTSCAEGDFGAEIRRRLGITVQRAAGHSLTIPTAFLFGRGASMLSTTGQHLVQTGVTWMDSFLRSNLLLARAGITVLEMPDTRRINLAAGLDVGAANASGEGQTVDDIEIEFQGAQLIPEPISTRCSYSRSLVESAGLPGVGEIMRRALVERVMQTIHRKCLYSASGNITGLFELADAHDLSMSIQAPTPANLDSMILACANAGALADVPGSFLSTFEVANALLGKRRAADCGPCLIADTRERERAYIFGQERLLVSRMIEGDLGASPAVEHDLLYLGDPAQIVLGMPSTMTVIANPFLNAPTGVVNLQVFCDISFGTARPESVAFSRQVDPTA